MSIHRPLVVVGLVVRLLTASVAQAEVVVHHFDCPVCEDVRLVETNDEVPRVIDCPECAVTPV